MNDLISRAEAIELKPEFLNPNVNRETEEQTAIDRAYARGWNSCNTHWIDEISELPSAQPQQIVRCKDCKHNPKLEWFGCPMSHLNEKQRPETAWCWKGERKDDE